MDAGGFVALRERLRRVVRKCGSQQEALRLQRIRLRDQQLKLLRAVIKVVPDDIRTDRRIVSRRRD